MYKNCQKRAGYSKTFEGELVLVSMPGTQAEKFFFTVRSPDVAKKINETVGKRVRLVYEEHVGIPTSCFGETGYFVHDVQLLDNTLPGQSLLENASRANTRTIIMAKAKPAASDEKKLHHARRSRRD